jgi:hypothetical protein
MDLPTSKAERTGPFVHCLRVVFGVVTPPLFYTAEDDAKPFNPYLFLHIFCIVFSGKKSPCSSQRQSIQFATFQQFLWDY